VHLTKSQYQKILISLCFLLLAVLSVNQLFDKYAEQYTQQGLQRSISAFAIAKSLNGVISVVQGTEVAVEPAGIGLVLTPGQILDPANDLIERFSWVMLVCSTSLGIQSILLVIFSSFYFSIMVAALLVLMAVFVWNDEKAPVRLKNIVYRAIAFVIVLRFFIPLMAISSEGLYVGYLESSYVESTSQLEQANKLLVELGEENDQLRTDDGKDVSWYELMKRHINAAIESMDIDRRVEQLKVEADKITKYIIDLIVVFVIQTILLPLLFLWLSVKLIKASLVFRFFN